MRSVIHGVRLYVLLVQYSARAQLQYRASFAMHLLGSFVLTAGEFAAILLMFQRFRSIGGWELPGIAVLYGVSSVAIALGDF